MPLLAGITNFFDKYVLGYALGTAAGPSLEPFVQDLANEAWKLNQVLPVEPEAAAAIVAENVEAEGWGIDQAAQSGISADNFRALYGEALNAPGLGPLFELWRRGLIGDGDFVHGLRKAKLELRWDGPLEGLKQTLLSSEELANLQQQGFIDAGRADSEGALQGVTAERQQLRFEASGLPPGVAEGLTMLRRGIIDEARFAEIVREGHTKTKYTTNLLALRTVVLSAAEYATLYLKGWITQGEMNAGGALSGYTAEQMNQLYLAHGRPAAPQQMTTAWARGVDGPDGRPMDEAQFLKGIRESDIRPEWGPMLWGIRFAYPPLFQINRLVESGAITPTVGADWARKDRYAPEVVAALEAFWSGGTTTTADKNVTKAHTKAWTEAQSSYIAEESTAGDVQPIFSLLGVDATAQSEILTTWDAIRALVRKQLSPAQIKKAVQTGVINPATGVAWTQQEGLTALLARGYTQGDAEVILQE